jgi:hypothetical protein
MVMLVLCETHCRWAESDLQACDSRWSPDPPIKMRIPNRCLPELSGASIAPLPRHGIHQAGAEAVDLSLLSRGLHTILSSTVSTPLAGWACRDLRLLRFR